MFVVVGDYGGKITKPVTLKIENLRYAGGLVLTPQGLSQRKMSHVLGFLKIREGPAAFGVRKSANRKSDAERNVIIRQNHFPLLPLLPGGLR